ncbi:MAG: aldehyde dehydrogenase family protein, partial [Novosphingobium sp.]
QGIELANATEYGLSAAITGDPAKAAAVAPKLRAGMVAINNWGPSPGAARRMAGVARAMPESAAAERKWRRCIMTLAVP